MPLLQGADDTRGAIFKPIGPKARFLNMDDDYGDTIANQRHRMPELGRSTVHTEGVSLLQAWINNLPAASYTP
ncbi:hypothetical protein [Alkalimarinus alittae]|uniref:Uncharacterized protein n=1 Tax=Alkalimarinus alittae TaxID=2961619 RepID=A0ABY6N257_9ALTE|nr:hypothetical protein [Alkalimarinus alittae]UZE96193.1 hypothetical protein NKI27_00160 [Alkalimarinus alittae]